MKETILYISKTEQGIQSFLKYLQSKLKAEQKECTLDEKHNILKVPKYYDIVGKGIYGNRLGVGYGYCKYYCFSSKFDKSTYNTKREKGLLEQILMHTREGAGEISEHEVMYMLGLLPPQNLASATQGVLMDAAMPLMRERIESPLSPFAYKDELENALKERIFKGVLTSAT